MTSEQRADKLPYQPALDGLRALAVLAVIAYHGGYRWAKGGYLGVDTFFVLSGYLITALLLVEWRRAQAIDLLAFWGRRARRLLPALLLVLAAIAVYAALEVSPFELGRFRGDTLASLFYVANWRFILNGASYFDVVSAPSPVTHLWSLAIEEQFYLVWPVVVLTGLHIARGGRRWLIAFCVVGIAASTTSMAAVYQSDDPSRAYYGTDTRIHTILVGCLLALVMAKRIRTVPGLRALGAAAMVAVVWAMHTLGDQESVYYRGGSLAFAVAVALLIAGSLERGKNPVRSVLSIPPAVWIGRIAYGLYLWHWPVNVFLTETRTGRSGNELQILRLAVTFAAAIGSYVLVESPVRSGRLTPRSLRIVAPAAVTVVAVALIAAGAAAVDLPSYLGANTRTTISVYPCPPPTTGERSAVARAVTKGPPRRAAPPGGPVKVLLIGDSLACSVAAGLGPATTPALAVKQAAVLGCGAVSEQVYSADGFFPRNTDRCRQLVLDTQRAAITSFRPDLVVSFSTWEHFAFVDDNRLLKVGSPRWRAVLQHRLDEELRRVAGAHARLVVTTAAPPASVSFGEHQAVPERGTRRSFRVMNDQLRIFAQRHARVVTLVDVEARVCPDGWPCPTRVDGFEPRPVDGTHFDAAGSVWIARWLLPQLEAAARDDAGLRASGTVEFTGFGDDADEVRRRLACVEARVCPLERGTTHARAQGVIVE